MELNENLVAQGDRDAIELKVEGLAYGRYGYPYEPQAAKELNEFMIMRGDVREFLKSGEGAKLVSTPANLIIEYAS